MKTGFVAAFVCLVTASAAQAAPTVYFGENQSPGGVVSGAPSTARSAFLGSLSGVGNEDFESFTFGDLAPISLAFTGSSTTLTATLTGAGQVENRTAAGRFNTSPGGSKWWDVAGAFNIAFATPIAAFGFYGTDIGDFNGQVTLNLTDVNNVVTTLIVNNTISGRDGSLLFFGFIDPSNTYKNIAFGNTGSGSDFFGFDDMVIGDQRQICTVNCGTVPEPATLALLGVGLAGLGYSRRKP